MQFLLVLQDLRTCQACLLNLHTLISGVRYYDGGLTAVIFDLTPAGHQFLADIRKDTNWNKTKEIVKNVGSDSLDTLKQIATGVITSLIQSALTGA